MTILATDLNWYQSERLSDNPDGGGRMSGNVIVNGQLNNLFSDISDLDRVTGRASLRKGYAWILSPNTDPYLGAHVIVDAAPEDTGVTLSMFSTGSFSDDRAQAQARVESFLIQGPPTSFGLFGSLIAGQNTVQMYCRAEAPSPDIGDVYVLSQEAAGFPPLTQFVRVRNVLSRTTQTFEDQGGTYQRDVIIFEITDLIRSAFTGLDLPPRNSATLPPTRIRTTSVADAARYYSIGELTELASIGDLTVKLASPYITIIPSTTQSVPQVDVLAGLGSLSMVASGPVGGLTLTQSAGSQSAGASFTRFLGSTFARRSLTAQIGAVLLVDDGEGGIVADDPLQTGWSGTADYQNGAVTISNTNAWSGTVNYAATAAGAVLAQTFSDTLQITVGNRSISYVYQIPGVMARGTLILDYLALGKWIRLRDNGRGQLVGRPGEGGGTINYAFGSVAITLGALPDIGSQTIFAWGESNRAQARFGDADITAPEIRHTVTEGSIFPGSLTISWFEGAVAKTATDNGSGAITGHATGIVLYGTGEIAFRPTNLPDVDSSIVYDYDSTALLSSVQTPTATAGSVSFTIPGAPLKPGSVDIRWNAIYRYANGTLGVQEDIVPLRVTSTVDGFLVSPIGSMGGTNTINHTTGEVTLQVEQTRDVWVPQIGVRQNQTTGVACLFIEGWERQAVGLTFVNGSAVTIQYAENAATIDTEQDTTAVPGPVLDLTPTTREAVVQGSVRFTFRGRTYTDRGGSLVYAVDPASNAATVGGTINYSTGRATITDYVGGGANTVSIASLLTRFREVGVSGVFFRGPGAPLQPGAFTVRATEVASGVQITGTADINGTISGTRLFGQIDWETGAISLSFGEVVTAAGNEAMPWYDAALVDGGLIFKPSQVDPASIFIGVVVLQSIPIDANVLGLDPVRLPQDGRVQFVRPGDVAVVHNTKTASVSPTAGQVVNLSETNTRLLLEYIIVRDSDGDLVDPAWFTLDLDAATVTFADPLNLAAYTLPLLIEHRISDARLVADVQITGEIGLASALTHTYPAEGTYLSTALLAATVGPGDLQARVENLFDQVAWTGVWADGPIGDEANGTYNDLAFPIVVRNDRTVTDRVRLQFTSATAFNVFTENFGQIASGNTSTDLTVNNPLTGTPLFTLLSAGFGGSWVNGNVLRFDLVGAQLPAWFLRCTQQGPPLVAQDSGQTQLRGNAA